MRLSNVFPLLQWRRRFDRRLRCGEEGLNAIKIAPDCQFPAFDCEHWSLHRQPLGDIEETLVGIANWAADTGPERGLATIVEEAPELSRPLALGFPLEYGDEACQFAVRVAVGGSSLLTRRTKTCKRTTGGRDVAKRPSTL